MEKKIMLGNEAFARGAYEAGVKVVSSYPGTPSTEVTETAAKYDEIYVEWAPNEKVGRRSIHRRSKIPVMYEACGAECSCGSFLYGGIYGSYGRSGSTCGR